MVIVLIKCSEEPADLWVLFHKADIIKAGRSRNMDNQIKREAWSGDVRTLIKIAPCSGWKISHDTMNIKVPVLTLSPIAAKQFVIELERLTEFYRSDYHLWSQRKANKRIPKA